jgi:catechol 2,3-dioxygenase-like lactoylglutathione lyase family enzyme
MAEEFIRTIPIFRIFDLKKAREFYVDLLGFRIDWEHRFEADSPIYMSVSRGNCVLHLTEHHGDGAPGSTAIVSMRGIDEFHREIVARNDRFMRPGVRETEWKSKTMEVVDPFGNRIRFDEPREAS